PSPRKRGEGSVSVAAIPLVPVIRGKGPGRGMRGDAASLRTATLLRLRGQNFLHLGDQIAFLDGDLRGAGGAPFGIVGDLLRQALALDQVLDLHFAKRALVAALNDHARAAAPVGIFDLRLHAGTTEIKLGADAGGA